MPNETKYEKLQEQLKAELASGKFRPGDRFYTEREIMELYGVSGITVARALNEMTQKGYFKRKRKLGTFVLESPEIPGMTGTVMTRPLYINRIVQESSDETRNGPSWFVVEEIRRGITLHDVDLAETGVPLVAVLKLIGHLAGFQSRLAADAFPHQAQH